ncbi:MAG: DinB family protein [Planctomycetota bacterium]
MFEKEIKVLRFMQGYGDDLVADIEPADFCLQPVAGMNHPAWIIGHLALAADHHATYAGGGVERQLESWGPRFGFGSPLTSDPKDYPTKDELLAAWHDANERYIAAVSNADKASLVKPTEGPLGEALPTTDDFLTFSLTAHTSLHLGQLSAWRRADGRKPLF